VSTAIVVGGSLTGLAAAIALARAGLHVTVLKQTVASERSDTGLGVDRALLAEVGKHVGNNRAPGERHHRLGTFCAHERAFDFADT
jgi:2-polyprenyl-6-methoxyphenol hydroxylase-like FAD-dependent oxidoreductase